MSYRADVAELKTNLAAIVTDVRHLRDSCFESNIHYRIRPLLSQHLGLRRIRVVRSDLRQAPADFDARVAQAADEQRITDEQEHRIVATDIILTARSGHDGSTVWIPVQVASRIIGVDISRSRQSADALAAVFAEPAVPVVIGYRIEPADRQRADAARVRYVTVSESLCFADWKK